MSDENRLHGLAAERQDARFEVVDIADYDLPLLDEPVRPMAGQCGVPIQTTTLGPGHPA